jgi:hypothetical protein
VCENLETPQQRLVAARGEVAEPDSDALLVRTEAVANAVISDIRLEVAMTPERRRKIEELFRAIREREPGEAERVSGRGLPGR